MRKKNITRKLIMSISTAAMTAICLGTSTYAWFSRNENVWLEETDLYVSTYDGLLISLDGKNFSQDITADQLKQVITEKETAEEARDAYKELNLIGTTINQLENSTAVDRNDDGSLKFVHDTVEHKDDEYINYIKLYNQSNNNLVATLEITTSDNKIINITAKDADTNVLTVKDKNGNALTDTDDKYESLLNDKDQYEFTLYDSLNNLVTEIKGLEVISYVRENFTAKASATENYKYVITYKDNGYSHVNSESVANKNYLKFDLYFRISSDSGASGAHPEYDLKFTDETFIKTSENAIVTLNNDMTAKNNQYKAGDEIEFDVANAMRIGVDSDSLNIFEVNNDLDLGSVAVENSNNPLHDKTRNAMYTYYNSLFPNYPHESAALNGDRFDTKTEYTNTSLGKFTYDSAEHKYNDVKATFYVWLEGWDADFFLGTAYTARQMSIKMEFKYLDE